MNIPILGIVENMSYFECDNCNKRHYIYGESHIDEIAAKHNIDSVSAIPMNSKLAGATDTGLIELFEGPWLDSLADSIEKGE